MSMLETAWLRYWTENWFSEVSEGITLEKVKRKRKIKIIRQLPERIKGGKMEILLQQRTSTKRITVHQRHA